jgi:oligoribonuclease NrnB/cAMP/cGMP phosphodiesterase (DHH superfamily)
MAKEDLIFTDLDLDGSCSYLTYSWFTQTKPKVITVKVSSIREKFLTWLKHNKISDYKRIYFFDLDTTEIKDLIDKKNVTIFDHHKSHEEEYKNATTIIDKECTSCSKLIYTFYKDKANLTVEQKKLIALVNDYDCYELKFPESNKLNFLFWYKNGDKLQNFINDFESGFHGFDNEQNKIISYHFYKFKKLRDQIQLYKSTLSIGKKKYKFVSTFANEYVNDLCQYIIDNNDCDVCLMINLKNNRVYLRKNRKVDLNLGKFAKKVCEGGGHEYAAGGVLNDNILALSKKFIPLNG